jgi:hypothetical protein
VKRNPVVRAARAALTDVNTGEVWAVISVKISDGKMGSHLGRESRRGCPSPRNSQEPAERCEGAKGGLPNNAFVNPRSHKIQIRKPAPFKPKRVPLTCLPVHYKGYHLQRGTRSFVHELEYE